MVYVILVSGYVHAYLGWKLFTLVAIHFVQGDLFIQRYIPASFHSFYLSSYHTHGKPVVSVFPDLSSMRRTWNMKCQGGCKRSFLSVHVDVCMSSPFLLFKCRWRHCWCAPTSGRLTKIIYQIDRYFLSIS